MTYKNTLNTLSKQDIQFKNESSIANIQKYSPSASEKKNKKRHVAKFF